MHVKSREHDAADIEESVMNNSIDTTVALFKIHRLTLAAIEVVRRHPESEVIASVGETLAPLGVQLSDGYRLVESLRTQQSALVAASEREVESLYQTMRAWLAPLTRDVPGFDPTRFGARPKVSLDVITDARALIEVIAGRGEALSYGQRAITALTARVDAASAAYTAAQDARIALQTKQAENRELGAAVQVHLVALRAALRAEVGTQSLDYQRLRIVRKRKGRGAVDAADATDDAVLPVTDDEVVEAPAPTTAPSAPVMRSSVVPNGHSSVAPSA